ncbi:hypothetical protein [Schaedlerella sp.]|jgi:hypothetical protein|uniref:hypothetical protein n=1 Tax=Schaedlerella sp. TaxID=2676057 RepID=UPI001363052A|nr:hypothetical protein [uncultured Schaedlerella sp.]MCI8767852.1 hypothetical protein [Ruminococcus sp.]MCI9328558.1 hypothetical protein [Ruminococcus sp.]NBI99152.1 hypothetical protein [Lachnospiraceae bacterium]
MAEKKENHLISFIRKYAAVLLAGCAVLLLAAYFINIMFVQNKKTAVSVLVLEFMEDTSVLEQQVREVLGAAEDEEIEIRTISAGVGTNKAVALTWIRAEVVDVVIGEEEQMTEYAQAGYLKDLGDTEAEQPDAFLCGLAEYDKEGNVTGTGPESCFGKYAGEIAGVPMEKPVAGLAGNASNLDNALMLLNFFSEN